MAGPKLSRLELQVMDAFWAMGPLSVREAQESFAEGERPAYTTIQTVIYRLEAKKALRRLKKIGNAHVFEAAVTRAGAHRRVIDDLLGLLGGRPQHLMATLVEAGKITLQDVKQAEELLKELEKKK